MLGGIAFGLLFLARALAIVLYFVLPTVWGILGDHLGLDGAAEWLDLGLTMAPLVEVSISGREWAQPRHLGRAVGVGAAGGRHRPAPARELK